MQPTGIAARPMQYESFQESCLQGLSRLNPPFFPAHLAGNAARPIGIFSVIMHTIIVIVIIVTSPINCYMYTTLVVITTFTILIIHHFAIVRALVLSLLLLPSELLS